uniref:Uncharacterized protein n=1 Tax=Meloidogyne enterolobii TaxID=390850 RepID=A0A6V7VR65_MELEN|nr:unnamed protein product [Meloidogyne enterolobii]
MMYICVKRLLGKQHQQSDESLLANSTERSCAKIFDLKSFGIMSSLTCVAL